MRAVVATRCGGVLDIIERPTPSVGPEDVLISVRAASLNPLDFKVRDGKTTLVLPLKPPVALGCDVAQVGAQVTRFKAGDERGRAQGKIVVTI
jgi:NADPH:quinone reductase-like Zn-dependent oxidoreductase